MRSQSSQSSSVRRLSDECEEMLDKVSSSLDATDLLLTNPLSLLVVSTPHRRKRDCEFEDYLAETKGDAQ